MIEQITNAEYHGRKEYWGSTSFIRYWENPQHIPFPPKMNVEPLNFGTAMHTLLLEPDKFHNEIHIIRGKCPTTMPEINDGDKVVRTPDEIPTRRGKGFKQFEEEIDTYNKGAVILTHKEWDWWCQQNATDKTPISEEDYQTLLNMQAAWGMKQHSYARKLISEGEFEIEFSFFWTDPITGLKCKCRTDVWRPNDGRKIIDVKSCQNASYEAFKRVVLYQRHYGVQAVHYKNGVEEEVGEPHDFIYVAQEKKPPYSIGVYKAKKALEDGAYKLDYAKQGIKRALETGYWPSYHNGEVEI